MRTTGIIHIYRTNDTAFTENHLHVHGSLSEMSAVLKCFGCRSKSKRKKAVKNRNSELVTTGDEYLCKNVKDHCDFSSQNIDDLPFEILDTVFQKTCLLWMLVEQNINPKHQKTVKSREVHRLKDKEIMTTLGSVKCFWYKRITRRRFKKLLMNQLAAFYANERARVEMIRKSERFLVMNIQPSRRFIDELLSRNCLSNEQVDFLDGFPSGKDKCFEILRSLNFRDYNVYSSFILSLRRSNQDPIAEIIKLGGVVEIKVANKKMPNLQLKEQQLVTGVNGLLLNKFHFLKPPPFRDIIYKLRMEGLEILQMHQIKSQIILFVRGQSEKAIKWIQRSEESGHLLEVITQLFRQFNNVVTPRCITLGVIPKGVRTDCDEIIEAKFIATHDIENVDYVRGVTKLLDKICVIHQARKDSSCSLLIFEDQSPFNLQCCAELNIEKPLDCVADKWESCLYVYDKAKHCFWRIKVEWKDAGCDICEERWLTDVPELSGYMTVSRIGQVLVLQTNGKCCTLSSYNQSRYQGEVGSVQLRLPKGILEPRHIADWPTLKGSYMIIHKIKKEDLERWTVSEVSEDGLEIINRYIPKDRTQILQDPHRLSLGSFDRVFVADVDRVILLDSNLEWNRVVIQLGDVGLGSETRIGRCHMVYDEKREQLIVGDDSAVRVWRFEVFKLEKDSLVFEDTERDFTPTLDIEYGKHVRGITTLKNKIYVMCRDYEQHSSSIAVFEAQNPFRRQADIETPYLLDGWDIAASEKEECLFIHDLFAYRIWKIAGENIIDWYEPYGSFIAWTMSMSREGNAIIFGREKRSCTWNVYEIFPDESLSTSFSEDVVGLRHVVETSKGNYLIIHRKKKKVPTATLR